MNITTEICDISPDLARDMLGKNTHNRRIRASHIASLATDMRNGDWQLNGDAIKFDVHGVLLDGQHRLLAVIEADVTVPMLLIWNVQPEAQSTYDVGARRSFSDVLTLRGESNCNVLATCVRWHYLYSTGRTQSSIQVTHSQLLDHFNKNRASLIEGVRLSMTVRHNVMYPTSAVSATFSEIIRLGIHSGKDLDDFVDKLKSGAGLDKGHPILTFRTYAANTAASAVKPQTVVQFAIFIKTWNAYIEGRKVNTLSFKAGGASPEKFPVIM